MTSLIGGIKFLPEIAFTRMPFAPLCASLSPRPFHVGLPRSISPLYVNSQA